MESCTSFIISSQVTTSSSNILPQAGGSLKPGHSTFPALNSRIISRSADPDMPQENEDCLVDHPEEMGQSQPEFRQPDREVLPASDKNQDSKTNKPHTDFLGDLISRLNTMANDNLSTEEEVIRLPRSQLTIIVKQMLVMQTLCNFMQELTQEKLLKQRSLIPVEETNEKTELSSYMVPNPTSFSQMQDAVSEKQVFRFDSSVPDQSKHIIIGNVILESSMDQNKSTFEAGNKVGPLEMDVVLKSSLDSGSKVGSFERDVILTGDCDDRPVGLETDGESLKSMSLQLPSQLNLDGDHPPDESLPSKDEPPRGYTPVNGSKESDTLSSSLEKQFNIPDLDLIEGSQECCQPFQKESVDFLGDIGVSAQEFELMQEELDKSKRLMHVLLQENEHLKETVRKLEEANVQLKDKETRVIVAGTDQQDLAEKLKKMEKYILMKDHAMAALNSKITDLQNENKNLKDQRHVHSLSSKAGPQSQPPSDTGYSALPPIVEPGVCCVSRETQTCLQEDRTDANLCAELESVRAANKNLQKQLDLQKHCYTQMRREAEQTKTLEKQLTVTKEKLLHYQEKLKKTEEHRRELAAQITGIYDEIERERRKSVNTEERYQRLKGIMEDERKRFSRDEKELLNRYDQLEESNNLLRSIVLILEARLENSGQPGNVNFSSEQLNELAQLRGSLNPSIRDSSPGALTSASVSTRPCWPSPTTNQSRKSGTGVTDGTAGSRLFETSVSRSTPNLHKNMPQASPYPPHCTPPVWQLSSGGPLPPAQNHHRLQSGNKGSGSTSVSHASSPPSVALQPDQLGQYKTMDKREEWVCPYCQIAHFESEEKFQNHLQQCSDCHC